MPDIASRLARLPLWGGSIDIEPLAGGMTNRNLLIRSSDGRFVARIAGDNAAHDVNRKAEQALTQAAAAAGIGAELVWTEPDLMILRYIEGHVPSARELGEAGVLEGAVDLLIKVRDRMPRFCRGQMPDRRPATLLARYVARLLATPNRWREKTIALSPLISQLADKLACAPEGLAHNDVHAGNFIHDGAKLWLVDWEYAGWGQSMMDVASLANNGLFPEERAGYVLELWCGERPGARHVETFAAMRLAAALRDLLWGYAQDTLAEPEAGNLDRYIAANEQRVADAAPRVRLS